MKTFFVAFGIIFLSIAGQSFAEPSDAASDVTLIQDESDADALVVPHWDFLGCVHQQHDCDHLAHSYGYHHHYATYDHHTCSASHLACYGSN